MVEHLLRTAIFLLFWHELESFLWGFPTCASVDSETKLVLPPLHASPRFAVTSEHLHCGEVSVCSLRARLILKSGPAAKVPNYLWSRFETGTIARRLYQVAFKRHQIPGVNKSSEQPQQLLEEKGSKSRGSTLMDLCRILRNQHFWLRFTNSLLLINIIMKNFIFYKLWGISSSERSIFFPLNWI